MNHVVDCLVRAIHSGRTDIVRSVITTCQTGPTHSSELDRLLSSPLTENGTLLHLACQLGAVDIVRTLLAAGADTCVHNASQQTALDVASSHQVKAVFEQQLLQCVAQSDVGRVCQLLAAGVDVNLRDCDVTRNTPLHWAASYGSQEVIACLCDRGAEVLTVNCAGATPLHDAVLRAHPAIVHVLLSRGARQAIHTHARHNSKYRGKSPLELALEQGGGEIYTALMASDKDKTPSGPGDMHATSNGDVVHDADKASLVPLVPVDLNHADKQTTNQTSTLTENQTSNNLENGELELNGASSESNGQISDSVPTTPITPNAPIPQISDLPLGELAALSVADKAAGDTDGGKAFAYLWPRPHTLIERSGKPFVAQEYLLVFINAHSDAESLKECLTTWAHYTPAVYGLGLAMQIETLPRDMNVMTPHITCEVNRTLFPHTESYRLNVSENQIRVQCSDQTGLHSAVRTLLQLLRFSQPDGIPPVQIHDWPSLSCRGVLLDLSKGRVPHLDILKNFICIAATLKINQLQLYTRASVPKEQAQRWQFPYPRSELLDLDGFCTAFGISLVPVLDIVPSVTLSELDDLYQVFQHFLTCFTSTKTVGVGPRLTNLLTDISDDGELSLEDASRFLPTLPHHTLQLCAYQFHTATGSLSQLPCGTMLAEYGFQSNYDFEKHCRTYEEHGIAYSLVAGSAAWNSLAGCPEAAVANIHSAVQAARSHNALGVLLSHWSGTSHVTPHCIMWPALVVAAGLTWNADVSKEFISRHVADLINSHVLGDEGVVGQVVVELGRAETYILKCSRGQASDDSDNLPTERGSTLQTLLTDPDKVNIEHLTVDHFQRAMRHIRKCQNELSGALVRDPIWVHVLGDLSITADLMMTSCRLGRQLVAAGRKPGGDVGLPAINPGIANLSPTAKTDFANRLIAQLELYREAWLAGHVADGLEDSVAALSHTLNLCVPDQHKAAATTTTTVSPHIAKLAQ